MKFTTILFALLSSSSAAVKLAVRSSGGTPTSPLQYGIMFEEINRAGDGGIYAELIQNRAFQAESPDQAVIAPWTPVGGAVLSLQSYNPLSSALPVAINVGLAHSGVGPIGIANPGYFGIGVSAQEYSGSFWVLGSYSGNYTASLSSIQTGQIFASTTIPSVSQSNGWTQYNFTLNPTVAAQDAFNQFSLTFDPRISADLTFNLISLFPPTWQGRENGMRIDLMNNVADLNPSFMRFPGGSNLLGLGPPSHWRWNDTIGPLQDRPGYNGAWQYQNTNGLGLAEFMDWCEDLNMTSILALWAGTYINGYTVSDDELDSVIQDALNEIEYVVGSTSTQYGAMRAANGRTEPWRLGYVEIGNEDYSSTYGGDRFPKFYNAIRQQYPNLGILSSNPYLNVTPYANTSEDYHLYSRPDNLVQNFRYFDGYPSKPKYLIGELACLQYNDGNPGDAADFSQPHIIQPFWAGSVAEAIYYLGLEQNSNSILGVTYFSLLENFVSTQWSPGMIRYNADPANTMRTTSYQVFQLFSKNRIAQRLPVKVSGGDFGPAYWVAGKDASKNYVLKAAVYNSSAPIPFTVSFQGVPVNTQATLTVLSAPNPFSTVEIGTNPVATTVTTMKANKNGRFSFNLPPLSVAVFTFGN